MFLFTYLLCQKYLNSWNNCFTCWNRTFCSRIDTSNRIIRLDQENNMASWMENNYWRKKVGSTGRILNFSSNLYI